MTKSFENKLIHETSPYLLQHAHNPVDWYPWGEEALQRAKAEDKPILVSIGYAACHWCHVMERESFENEATASFMNEHFINIKIDREERPDLDHIYMDAVQAMSGSGGWPLNVFLTPDQLPFYGGTYFPPTAMHNRPSWLDVLGGVSKGYQEKKSAIFTQAETLKNHLVKSNSFGMVQPDETEQALFFSEESLNTIAEKLLEQADTVDGGFGNAPKFPQSNSIVYLLRHYHFTKDQASLDQALLSIDKMIQGGIYDQVGGGFARYSTDAQWLVPHFEKMLYDNALLIIVLSEAYQLTQNKQYQLVIEQTLQFIHRELTDSSNGFYSALDADSEGVEGKFYTWNYDEIIAVLGEDADFFCTFFQVEKNGNWHEGRHENPPTNILWIDRYPSDQELALIAICKDKLLAKRASRIRPLLDDKILLGWNALMITAYCKAAALGNPEYLEIAKQTMQFLEEKFNINSPLGWNHTYKNGVAKIPAFLDDYAYLIQAYIHLQELTGNSEYLLKAKSLTEWVMDHFSEESTGFFYYTPDFQKDIIVRKKEVFDGATPSGNAIMAINLYYLSVVFDESGWQKRSTHLTASLSNAILKHPTSFACWASLLQTMVKGNKEIVVTGQQALHYLNPINRAYIPNKIIQASETNLAVFPLLTGKEFEKEAVLFYLCENYTCGPAFRTVETLLANM
ncbi:MAG: thioredoxin domain-containing protein [Sphingobacteriia bacterium]|nr:MAG: thioredoxin domain-containing protein [Sphingobacteriia bacterium]